MEIIQTTCTIFPNCFQQCLYLYKDIGTNLALSPLMHHAIIKTLLSLGPYSMIFHRKLPNDRCNYFFIQGNVLEIISSAGNWQLVPWIDELSIGICVLIFTSWYINLSPPCATYMQQWMRSALVQVMAFAYSASSHYLKQCWSIVNWNFSFTKMYIKYCLWNGGHFVQGRWVKLPLQFHHLTWIYMWYPWKYSWN